MNELRLPQKVTIQLFEADGQPLRMPNILFRIITKPQRKNPYRLGPYPTNDAGIVLITRGLIDAEVDATIDSGLMDYACIESSFPEVMIAPYSGQDIDRALAALMPHDAQNLVLEECLQAIDTGIERVARLVDKMAGDRDSIRSMHLLAYDGHRDGKVYLRSWEMNRIPRTITYRIEHDSIPSDARSQVLSETGRWIVDSPSPIKPRNSNGVTQI